MSNEVRSVHPLRAATNSRPSTLHRELALEFAQSIQPWLSSSQLQEIADALNGSPEAQNCSIEPSPAALRSAPDTPSHHAPVWNDTHSDLNDTNTVLMFVDYVHGDDRNDGSLERPVQHLQSALDKLRSTHGSKYKALRKKLILRKGSLRVVRSRAV